VPSGIAQSAATYMTPNVALHRTPAGAPPR